MRPPESRALRGPELPIVCQPVNERAHGLPCCTELDRPEHPGLSGAATGAVTRIGAGILGPTLARRLPLRQSVMILDVGTIGDGVVGHDRVRRGRRA